jgi:hypothetical protein
LPQTSGEETPHSVPSVDSTIQHSSPNVVRKVLMEPALSDMVFTASQDPRHMDEDDGVGGGVSLFHSRMLPIPDACLLS